MMTRHRENLAPESSLGHGENAQSNAVETPVWSYRLSVEIRLATK